MSYIEKNYQDYDIDNPDFSQDNSNNGDGNYSEENTIEEPTESGDSQPSWQNWKSNWNDQPEQPEDSYNN
ncbi:MAG: hypothetical protein ACRC80_13895, partial [Waterburya sp.]